MKPQPDDNEIATKGFFRAELKKELKKTLKNYPTKKELKKILEDYPTKKDLAVALLPYAKKSDLDNLEKKFDEVYLNTRNDMMQFKDDIISMFLELKTEIQSLTSLYKRSDEKIHNHEIRITRLESNC